MSRFNLESLPKCGAKTSSGNPCKRFGNKRNGRCKLHGGRSTGAKTTQGKLAVRANPVKNGFAWSLCKELKPEYLQRGIAALQILQDLATQPMLDTNYLNDLIKEYRVELEVMKYRILEVNGIDDFLKVQSALDVFYKNTASDHLKFHLHTITSTAPYFDSGLSKAEMKYITIEKGFKFKF